MHLKNILVFTVVLCTVSLQTRAVGEIENIGLGIVSGFACKHLAQTDESAFRAAGNIAALGAAAGCFSGFLTMNAMDRNRKPAQPGSGGPTAVGVGDFTSQLFTNGALLFATTLATAVTAYGIEWYIKFKREVRLEHARQKSTKNAH